MIPAHLIAYFCVVTGLSMVAGWWVAFRNRPYLGLLGASFLVLAVYVGAGQKVSAAKDAGATDALMARVLVGSLVVFVALLAAAVVAAVKESRRRLAEVREHFRAAEEGFVAMMEAERRRRAEQQAGAAPGGDQPKDESEGESER